MSLHLAARRLVAGLLLCLLLCSCRADSPSSPASQSTSLQFTDSTGAAVALSGRPERVAVLFSSYAEIWHLAGGQVAVTVGESVERGFAGSDAVLVDEGAGKTINHELLLQAQPDLVIASADIPSQVEACRVMARAGIPCALFRVDTLEDYLDMLKVCTDLTGSADAYERHGVQVAREAERILEAARAYRAATGAQPRFLFVRAGSQYSATKAKRAPDNFVCTMLRQLGGCNIADEADVLLDGLSLEEILLRDPEQILLTTMGSEQAARAYITDLFAQEGWRDLQAVREGNYTFLPKDLFHFKPNARWAQAYAQLCQLLYPELELYG